MDSCDYFCTFVVTDKKIITRSEQLFMKKSLKLRYLLLAVAFVALTGACGRTSGNSDRPPLQHSDADRKFDIVLEITCD
ncbi:MAG: hypothetical protein K2F79_05960, partial [Muribaculaceae bacterium]|nr:hypothetical protein [Muribaculaceae bacterium]